MIKIMMMIVMIKNDESDDKDNDDDCDIKDNDDVCGGDDD
jgi:hypothetical protein